MWVTIGLTRLTHLNPPCGVARAEAPLPPPPTPRHPHTVDPAISTPDSTFGRLSVESEVCRYPKRPGSSIGDDVAENGAKRRMGSNRLFGANRSITPLIPHAPFGTILGHIVASGQTRPFWISTYFALCAPLLRRAVRGRDCNLVRSPAISMSLNAMCRLQGCGDVWSTRLCGVQGCVEYKDTDRI